MREGAQGAGGEEERHVSDSPVGGWFPCRVCGEYQERPRDPDLVRLVAALAPLYFADDRDRHGESGDLARARLVRDARTILAEIDRPAEGGTA